MAIKPGLNRQEQVLVRKGFNEKVPVEVMAAKFKTTSEVIKRFTPEKQDAAKKRIAKANEAAKQEDRDNQEKGKILKAALGTDQFS